MRIQKKKKIMNVLVCRFKILNPVFWPVLDDLDTLDFFPDYRGFPVAAEKMDFRIGFCRSKNLL